MTDLNPNHAEDRIITRKCPRRMVQLQFHIGGLDQDGHFFEETVTTRDISDGGGCFRSCNSHKIGTTLGLSGLHGFVSLIRIVWVRERPDTEIHDIGFLFINPLEN